MTLKLSLMELSIGGDSWLKAGNIKMPFTWLQTAADSGASASGEATTEFATPILEEMPKFYEAIMQIFIPNPEIAVWFQRIVVITEIGIGLCLIAGLFTFLASGASAFMVVTLFFQLWQDGIYYGSSSVQLP